jgi:2-(1,2-epoxy-1,2-dihydrophenyl)acetyl-CoA isomerase
MPVTVQVQGPAAVVTMDWPAVRNALTTDDMAAVAAAMTSAAEDRGVTAVILTGEGAFCAGANLRRLSSDLAAGSDARQVVEGPAQGLIRAILQVPVTTVAAIDGPAIGLGFDLALACDSRLIGPAGWCMQGWGRIGLIPGTGGELLLRRLNPAIGWTLLEQQPRIDGELARRWGIGEPVTAGTARDAALRRAAGLSDTLTRTAIEGYVRLSRAGLRAELDAHLALCADLQAGLLASPDFAARTQSVIGGPAPASPPGEAR